MKKKKKKDGIVLSSSSNKAAVLSIVILVGVVALFLRSLLLPATMFRAATTTTATTTMASALVVVGGRTTRRRTPFTTLATWSSSSFSSFSFSSSALLSSSSASLSNNELAQRRIRAARERRSARERSVLRRTNRDLHIKRLLLSEEEEEEEAAERNYDGVNATSSSLSRCVVPPPLYAVKVTVADDLRSELQLSGREKRGRVFVEKGGDAVASYRALTKELHGFFTALRRNTFVLRASHPEVDEEGTVSIRGDAGRSASWPVRTDEDVRRTFAEADSFFEDCSQLRRPSIVLHIERDPDAPPPPPPPKYLEGMADPRSSPTLTMLSFYAFPPNGISDPDEFAVKLRKVWKPFEALGRVYVAEEGVNAQMSVPTNVLENFMDCCRSIPEFGRYIENDINIDPVPLTREEFARAGSTANASTEPAPPFKNLHVRVRTKIVADGLDRSYDWQSAGYDMPPLEWHDRIKRARERQQHNDVTGQDSSEVPIILDCRNSYETDVGRFEGAEPLDTENFRESWEVLEERLARTPKDAPIMTYCTGG